jgi:hypothetical protein
VEETGNCPFDEVQKVLALRRLGLDELKGGGEIVRSKSVNKGRRARTLLIDAILKPKAPPAYELPLR